MNYTKEQSNINQNEQFHQNKIFREKRIMCLKYIIGIETRLNL